MRKEGLKRMFLPRARSPSHSPLTGAALFAGIAPAAATCRTSGGATWDPNLEPRQDLSYELVIFGWDGTLWTDAASSRASCRACRDVGSAVAFRREALL